MQGVESETGDTREQELGPQSLQGVESETRVSLTHAYLT